MKTILAPIDFSSVTDAVVTETAALAQALSARVVLFTVVQPPAIASEYAALMENIAEIHAAGEKNAARQLAGLEEKLRARGLSVESDHAIGPPVSLILGQADESGADYIVMGSHGHTSIYDLLVGSTTHGVLMRAKCPVVIVPAATSAKASKPAKKTAARRR